MPAAKATEQSLEERLDQAVEQAQGLIKEIDALGAEAVERAERGVWENLRRYTSAREELQKLVRREGQLRGELADLPISHSRAVLEDDMEAASRVKQRHHEIRSELDAVDERLPQLERELLELTGPNVGKLPTEAQRAAAEATLRSRLVPPALDVALNPLAKLDKGVVIRVSNAIDVAKARARQHVGAMQSLNSEVQHHPDVVAERQRRRAEEDARNVHTAARSR